MISVDGPLVVPPSSVHPEPELRMPADVHLEHVSASLREFVDGVRAISARRLNRVLVNHAVAARAERQRETRDAGLR